MAQSHMVSTLREIAQKRGCVHFLRGSGSPIYTLVHQQTRSEVGNLYRLDRTVHVGLSALHSRGMDAGRKANGLEGLYQHEVVCME